MTGSLFIICDVSVSWFGKEVNFINVPEGRGSAREDVVISLTCCGGGVVEPGENIDIFLVIVLY